MPTGRRIKKKWKPFELAVWVDVHDASEAVKVKRARASISNSE